MWRRTIYQIRVLQEAQLTLVVFDGVQALDVAGPLDVFAEANHLLPKKDRYEITLVGERPGYVMCSSGMEFKVHYDYPNFHSNSDLLIVAGGPRVQEYRPEQTFLTWINERVQGTNRFGAICNGVFLLGHAGLLAGREVTTHWSHAERLSKQFPDLNVRPDRIFVRDGNLFTCGGVTAGIDLCLALISEDWGHELALKVAKPGLPQLPYRHQSSSSSLTSNPSRVARNSSEVAASRRLVLMLVLTEVFSRMRFRAMWRTNARL